MTDVDLSGVLGGSAQSGWLSTASVLGIGLLFGLKHALDADHLAAVSTIVSQRKSLLDASFVGALWGIGHTLALLTAGVAVIVLHVEIGARLAAALELCVALMLVGLGANTLRKLLHGGHIHVHAHQHGGRAHVHPHMHDATSELRPDAHHGLRRGMTPLLIGVVHGLAGSAALTLVVLTTLPTVWLRVAYLTIFGIGSIGGMIVMSALVSLPARMTGTHYRHADATVRTLAGIFSFGLGLFIAYQIGIGPIMGWRS